MIVDIFWSIFFDISVYMIWIGLRLQLSHWSCIKHISAWSQTNRRSAMVINIWFYLTIVGNNFLCVQWCVLGKIARDKKNEMEVAWEGTNYAPNWNPSKHYGIDGFKGGSQVVPHYAPREGQASRTADVIFSVTSHRVHGKYTLRNTFLNLVQFNQISIVITLFRLHWHKTEFALMPVQNWFNSTTPWTTFGNQFIWGWLNFYLFC